LSEIESIAEKLSLRYDLIDGPTFLWLRFEKTD
jgi:hypothetical protein